MTKVGTSTVGSTTKPIYLNAGTPTALSGTVGSTTKPIYLNAGTPTAISDTVGSATKPIYLSSGTLTASSSTVGSATQPVYLNSGTLTAGNAFSSEIVTKSFSLDNQTVEASGSNSFSISVSYSGYTLLGVIGFHMNNGSSNGQYGSYCFFSACYMSDSTTVHVGLRNTRSTDAKVMITIYCLYLKNS